MKKIVFLLAVMLLSFPLFAKTISENAERVSPLLNGQTIPDIDITKADGSSERLSKYLDGEKTVLFFYRGGWCPFCNTQMGQLKKIEPKLKALGFKLVGVSTDSPRDLQKSVAEHELGYELISDYYSTLSQAFGLAFFTDEKTTKRYLSRMNLSNPLQVNGAGEKRLVLPVPAIYVVDEKGLVQFNYVNPNFKVRLNEEVLLKVAETL